MPNSLRPRNWLHLKVNFQSPKETLRRHVAAINALNDAGMYFFDYGNAFLLEAGRAKANVFKNGSEKFRYPSYVQHIMGDIFSLGFGPYRWICSSGLESDLLKTDEIAIRVIENIMARGCSEGKASNCINYK